MQSELDKMEQDFYKDELELLLKEKTDQYRMYPSDKVWNTIQRRLHGHKDRWKMILLLFLFMSLSGITGYWLGLSNSHKNTLAPTAALSSSTTYNNQPLSSHRSAASAYGTSTITVSSQNQEGSLASRYHNFATSGKPAIASTNRHTNTSSHVRGRTSRQKEKNKGIRLAAAVESTLATSLTMTPGAGEENNLDLEREQTKRSDQRNNEPAKQLTQNSNSLQLPYNELAWQPISLTKRRGASRLSWNIYATGSSSYRKLLDESVKTTYPNSPMVNSIISLADVNQIVSHKPSLGIEVGTGLVFELFNGFSIRTGLQFNYNKYYIHAFAGTPTRALVAADPTNPSNLISGFTAYRSISTGQYAPITLENNYFQASVPLGLDLRLAGNKKMEWYVGGSIQSTYNLLFNTYLLSADKKSYVNANDFLRRWNFNTSFETGISIALGNNMTLQLAPQIRYQLRPSYIDEYAVKEFLLEYGFKIGIRKPFNR